MILSYFILAHLLGDFIFQPTRLVLWKIKSNKGVFVHALIHFFTNLLILFPIIINGYFWLVYIVFGISFLHFWIDKEKINYDLKHDKRVKPFIIDQLLHLLTILLAYFFISNIKFILPDTTFYQIYSDIKIISFISFLVFFTAVIEIFSLQRQREKNIHAHLKIRTEKVLLRVIVFTSIYALLMFLAFYASGKL